MLSKGSVAEHNFVCWQAATPIAGQSPTKVPNSSSNGQAVQGGSLIRDHGAPSDRIASRSLRSKRFFNSDGLAQ